MAADQGYEPAKRPEDLSDYFLQRANAGDVEGVVALYAPDTVLAFPPGQLMAGHDQIRTAYTEFLAGRPSLRSAGQQPALINGDIALTSTRLPAAAPRLRSPAARPTTWRWVIDQPSILP